MHKRLNRLLAKLPFSGGRRARLVRPPAYKPEANVVALFWQQVEARHPRRVLEAGTLRSDAARPTHSRANFPHVADSDYVRLDIRPGPDVDVVGNLHALPPSWTNSFDCFLAIAVWEHLERPWIAAREVARVLAPGGVFFISTHQSFPIHGYPNDYFRFSRDALRLLFEDAGLTVDAVDYLHRATIVPPAEIVALDNVVRWNRTFPSYIQVEATGHKPLQ